MGLTESQLREALRGMGALGGQGWDLGVLASGANEAMRQAGITTRKGAAIFVAQCMVESAWFRTTREIGGSRGRYAPYYGRGFIQVTWEENYRAFGKWASQRGLVSSANYFMKPNEDRLADPRWAWLGAVWYLTKHRHNLIALANAGDNIKVGRAINRGNAHSAYAAYGEGERMKAYNLLLKAGISAPGPDAIQTYIPSGKLSVKEVQQILGVKADGHYGEATKKAVEQTQKEIGLTADGLWGPATEGEVMALKDDIINGLLAERVTLSDADRKRLGGSKLKSISVEALLKYGAFANFESLNDADKAEMLKAIETDKS